MLTLSPSLVSRYKVLTIISITSAVWVLGTAAFSEANEENVRVRRIGHLDSVIADRIQGQVKVVPFTLKLDSPILLQGETMSRLKHKHEQELKEAYQDGHTIVLLDATMGHIKALHGIIGEGVNYRSDGEGVLAYTFRQENHIPTAKLLANVHPSPLQTPSGHPDPTGLRDHKLAFKRAADLTVAELRHIPNVSMPGPPRDPSQQADWQSSPLQETVFQQTGSAGVYNTTVTLYALHSCEPDIRTGLTSDYYMVTALADWTPTNARFQSADTDVNGLLFYDAVKDLYFVNGWRDDPQRNQCSSPSSVSFEAATCRYINYPLQYEVKMVPQGTGSIAQTDAKPPGGQGQATTYTSGFMFSLGGTVNVSGMGPGAGISAGAVWNNLTATTVPPLELDLSQTSDEGAIWTFKYCTGGEEPDPNTNCTSHVQTAKDVCRAQLGDDSGTNPQQGQTPVGAFTDAVQTALWQAGPDTRVGNTFDIEVTITPTIGYTTANLWGASGRDRTHAGCNAFNCDCVSQTTTDELPGGGHTFQLPLPSTICQ